MKFAEALRLIRDTQEIRSGCMDLKTAIFWDNLSYDSDPSIDETIAEMTYHNAELIKDAMQRTGRTLADLIADAKQLWRAYPTSYYGSAEREWAIWDIVDSYVMEVLVRDSRIRKRAGW